MTIVFAINGLQLVLARASDGYNYDWQDKTGRTVCCGWVCGTKEDAEREAVSHLRGAKHPTLPEY